MAPSPSQKKDSKVDQEPRKPGREDVSRGKIPDELPPELYLKFGDQREREFAKITYKLAMNDEFRESFLDDPGSALAEACLEASPEVIEAALQFDRELLEQFQRESVQAMKRDLGFRATDDGVKHLALFLAFTAGALLIELLHHHGKFTAPR